MLLWRNPVLCSPPNGMKPVFRSRSNGTKLWPTLLFHLRPDDMKPWSISLFCSFTNGTKPWMMMLFHSHSNGTNPWSMLLLCSRYNGKKLWPALFRVLIVLYLKGFFFVYQFKTILGFVPLAHRVAGSDKPNNSVHIDLTYLRRLYSQ